jgi:ferric-dicitrate binding protein FerR (iron transport regulator)
MNRPIDPQPDDANLEQLLRETGARTAPPADLMRDVHDAVHSEWRGLVAQRARRRRVRMFAAAATVAVAAVLGAGVLMRNAGPAQMLAQVDRLDGTVMRDAGLFHAAHPLTADDAIYVGDEVTTTRGTRAAFNVGAGFSLRLDADSTIRLIAVDRVVLERGALYIDVSPEHGAATDFIVNTHVGAVRHLGTQYEVREVADGVRVSVREGRVAIDKNGVLYAGEAGEQISINENGSVGRARLAPSDAQWQWVAEVAPDFDIENRPLVEFLDWLGRETGHPIEYATTQARQQAEQTILRGSIKGLDPRAALAAVLATTNLQVSENPSGSMVISARE